MRVLFAVLGGENRCRYLGMYNEVVMLFQRCYYRGQLAIAICFSLEIFGHFPIKNISVNAISIENTSLLLYALA